MSNGLTELSAAEMTGVTGGGWKSKAMKWGWETAKWTGIPTAIGGGIAWAERQLRGPRPPDPQNQDP